MIGGKDEGMRVNVTRALVIRLLLGVSTAWLFAVTPTEVAAETYNGAYCGLNVVSGSLAGRAGDSVTLSADCNRPDVLTSWTKYEYNSSFATVLTQDLGASRQITTTIPAQGRTGSVQLVVKNAYGTHKVSAELKPTAASAPIAPTCSSISLAPQLPYQPTKSAPIDATRLLQMSGVCPGGSIKHSYGTCETGGYDYLAQPLATVRLQRASSNAPTYDPNVEYFRCGLQQGAYVGRETHSFAVQDRDGNAGPSMTFTIVTDVDFPAADKTTTSPTDGAPQCTLSASPNPVALGSAVLLTASCNPVAVAYSWSGTGFSSSTASGSITPSATTTYSVVGLNAAGQAGRSASVTVTVQAATSSTPNCSLAVSNATPRIGDVVTLTATCVPSAISYSWANTSGPEAFSGASRSVTVTGSSAWSVRGANSAGMGNIATASVNVQNTVAAVEIVAGDAHTCALGADGSLRCWGLNDRGQVGSGSSESTVNVPTTVFSSGVTAVSAGGRHTCAIVTSALYCWGDNSWGQLGNGTTLGTASPIPVLSAYNVYQVSAGGAHTCALVPIRQLFCWGSNLSGEIGTGSKLSRESIPSRVLGDVNTVLAGGGYTCAHVVGEGFRCWGDNIVGQLGVVTATSYVSRASDAKAIQGTSLALLRGYARYSRTCVDFVYGEGVQCWGAAFDYLVARSNSVVIPSGKVGNISVGSTNACATIDGSLQCWGLSNDWIGGTRVYGPPTVLPPSVVVSSGVTRVALGASHICAIVDGYVECWGGNEHGQMGNGEISELNTYFPRTKVSTGNLVEVVEYFVPTLKKYFITARDTEKATLAQFADVYSLTGMRFSAYPAANPPLNTVPICRIYFAPPMANTHFYGAPSDCALVASASAGNSAVRNEGLDFAVVLADAAGNCP